MSLRITDSIPNWDVNGQASTTAIMQPTATAPTPRDTQASALSTDNVKTDESPSLIRRVGEWLYALLWGKCAQAPVDLEATSENGLDPIGPRPKLEGPDHLDARAMTDSIANINHHLIHRLEDTRTFEEEMLKKPVRDHAILSQLFECGLVQKGQKEELAIFAMSEVNRTHSLNKILDERSSELAEEIRSWSEKRKIPEWIGVISNYGISGSIAIAYATGGFASVAAIVVPLLTLTRGVATGAKAVLDYKTDKQIGELQLIKTKRGEHMAKNHQHMEVLTQQDSDRLTVIKALKEALRNYHKTSRAMLK